MKTRLILILAVTMLLGAGAYAGTRRVEQESIMASGINNFIFKAR